ncbi:death-on-curing family protein [Burkholderia thailandensis USAMRU Malaysia |uniref:type II toxin-antitoxin system death-on-curing family toxin n=1 Tax=pseudomallei group TaxID=111527 RepID=UPI00049A189B|nr:type II toxin-antitoxin system death-on-curing family toxin [Burkholderia thailandensis]WNO23827.1 toxin [Burkholderia phage phiBtTUL1a]AIC88899.1 death-on-curing family protein [Burkholderia thailandensis USAMRU Malaysia \
MILDADLVVLVHDFILSREPGLDGHTNRGALEGALGRIENRIHYEGLEDVFEIAGMYAVAIARGHAFSDANKRTALVSALTYLLVEGYEVARTQALEEIMVDVAKGQLNYLDLANIFSTLARQASSTPSF